MLPFVATWTHWVVSGFLDKLLNSGVSTVLLHHIRGELIAEPCEYSLHTTGLVAILTANYCTCKISRSRFLSEPACCLYYCLLCVLPYPLAPLPLSAN